MAVQVMEEDVRNEKQKLQEVREYEKISEKRIKKEERPFYHLSPRTGWMNDPNGFSVYKGQYHMFYQYNPYDTHWDTMHWGHAVSNDLLHWEYLPAALAPDEAYDADGCFSGSALELPDGRQLLMYTGVAKEKQEDGSIREIQTQCIAVGDGADYEKYEKNPVLDQSDLPEGGSPFDFRDPKIWQEEDGTYCCVAGNRPLDGSGQILLFTSRDGFCWNYKNVLCANRNRFGLMWECPDFFPLDGKWVLFVSPQDMLAKELEYRNGNGTLCLIGNYDRSLGTFTEEYDQSIDYGIDFYAPQTILSPDGRRIMIGWMQNWDTCSLQNLGQLWFGQMSIPRELSVKNGRLYQQPVRELDTMRGEKVSYKDVTVEGLLYLDGIQGRIVDMELTIRPKEGDRYRRFEVCFAQNKEFYTSLSFFPGESILKIDRRYSGVRKAVVHQSQCRVDKLGGELKLRILLDRFSVEVFVNGGEQVLSMVLCTNMQADGISFFADGAANIDVVKYNLWKE